jgi:aldehyde dehydrogenase (NAD+)
VAALIAARIEELCALECAETGKPVQVVQDEVAGAAEYFRFYGQAARMIIGSTFDAGPGRHLYLEREPYGVIGIVTPWNYAVNQAARGAAPALMSGNAVVLKPSEFATTTVLGLARLASEAGLPDGLLNVVVGSGASVGAALVAHAGIDKVTFTGSVPTGRQVAAACAERLVPVTLELGGKSPVLVFADADLDSAARDIAGSIFSNAGQTCSAGSRLLVAQSVHDELVARLVQESRKYGGDRGGPIITAQQYATVLAYLAVAEQEGAVTAVGGTADDRSGFIEPTIFTGVTNSMRIAQEEIFGPVLVVIPFDAEDEAVSIANDSQFGLVAGLWTRDLDRSFRVARRLAAGQVYVNGWGAPIEVPFGGLKASGFGREKGLAAIEEYTRSKGICFTLAEQNEAPVADEQ